MDEYVIYNGKKLRKGYTTGSCAAAAAKASAYMALTGKIINTVKITTPYGIEINLLVSEPQINDDYASCCIVKDAGDDPDVTDKLKIYAKVILNKTGVITIKGGEGIGKITLPGLKIPVGESAINPIPLKMIENEVLSILPKKYGAKVIIYAPEGVSIAKRTLNKKLGIVGGISILGTTGIVTPMSEDAYKETINIHINMISKKGYDNIVFVFGNIGLEFVNTNLKIQEDSIVKTSNYVGHALSCLVPEKFKKLLIVGHIGKMVKLSAGIFDTHSRTADARMEILTAYAALEGASKEVLNNIYNSVTTDAAVEIINENGIKGVYTILGDNLIKRVKQKINNIDIGCIIFDSKQNILYKKE